MTDRLEELDSVRGLAAATVVLSHTTIVLPAIAAGAGVATGLTAVLKYSPAHVLFAGHEAVITFFILSGFVLSLPYHAGRAPGYGPFLVKRVFRIWVPYVCAVLVGLLAMSWLARPALPGLSDWANGAWRVPLTPGLLLGHLSLVGSFPNGSVDPVIWSLVHEMRISLVFPLLMIAVLKFDWRVNLGAAAGLACVGAVATAVLARASVGVDYFATLEYVPMFVAGALLAARRERIRDWWSGLPRGIRIAWLPAGVTMYTIKWWAFHGNVGFPSDWVVAAGATMLIVAAFAAPRARAALRTRPLLFLGRVSYSLYLLHALVLLALLNLLYGRVPLALILVAAPLLSIGAAALGYRLVESPAMARGRRVASGLPTRLGPARVRQEAVPAPAERASSRDDQQVRLPA
jgi:peptidoglycan/LPS O-acetylase OafA/YrhL